MKKHLFFGFAMLEIAYWCFQATSLGFATAYLLHKGISIVMIPTVLSFFQPSHSR